MLLGIVLGVVFLGGVIALASGVGEAPIMRRRVNRGSDRYLAERSAGGAGDGAMLLLDDGDGADHDGDAQGCDDGGDAGGADAGDGGGDGGGGGGGGGGGE